MLCPDGVEAGHTEMVTDSTYGSAASTSGSTLQLDPWFYRYMLGLAAACLLVAVAAGLVSGSARGAIARLAVRSRGRASSFSGMS